MYRPKRHLKATCKGIRIPESGKCMLVESGILGFGTRVTAQGIPLTIGIQNPSSTEKDWNSVPAIGHPRRGIQNPRMLVPMNVGSHGANGL